MNVLIVEDDPKKSTQVAGLLRDVLPNVPIEERRSYQSGLRAILQSKPRLVILDMTMPTFDRSASETGWRTRAYAGRDILREVQRKKVQSSFVIVTQFESFGEPPHQKTLAELADELQRDFPNLYLGTVYYHPGQSDWKRDLTRLAMMVRDSTQQS